MTITPPPEWLCRALSQPRLDPYLLATSRQADAVLRLYAWNVEISAAFYGPLHWLEVSLRNSLHDRLREHHGRDDWWRVAPLLPESRLKVDDARRKARRKVTRDHNRPVTPDDVVAELTFGFWVELLSRASDRGFWVPVLHRAFPGYRGPRRNLHRPFLSMVLFRNRVMHYEPIHDRPLEKRHATLYWLLGCIDDELVAQARSLDRVPEVLARRPRPVPPR
ncbi:hypothetical protein DZF91_37790 [Actinomadura logoneensis]|uniref:Abi-like protein n=1 Tax=Actinomadura logoneensis TaxID=2293572 RepID=A0A372JAS5_9ACTN|nr:hypothetical protein [Actinomadura logoneensis]RFU36488.1 hypothetical protein DZF91_37790 [Actinomadura logoneensis]